jgi:D-aminopeptidase
VPVIFLSGDKAGCDEALEICPNLITAETKKINENDEIELLSRTKANKLIYEKAKEAIKNYRRNIEKFKQNSVISTKSLIATFATKELADNINHRCKVLKLDYKRGRNNNIQFNGTCFSQILKNFFSVLD